MGFIENLREQVQEVEELATQAQEMVSSDKFELLEIIRTISGL